MKESSKFWRLWCKALGTKEGSTDKEADSVAKIRSWILIQAMITNFFIISNAIVNWVALWLN